MANNSAVIEFLVAVANEMPSKTRTSEATRAINFARNVAGANIER